jgi:transposase
LLDRLNPTIAELSQAIEQEVEKCPAAQQLMTHPGVGVLTALAFVLIIGKAERFQCGKQIAAIWDWCRWKTPAAIGVDWGISPKRTGRCCVSCWWKRPRRKITKVALARRLAVRLFWRWRKGCDYQQVLKFGSHACQHASGDGVQ